MSSNQNQFSEFWQNRSVFITGATGLIGSWLVKALLERKARVVVLVHDADPQSELFRTEDIKRTAVVNGALEDINSLERAINKHEVDTVFHLGAQTIVGRAHRSPLATFEANIRGTYNLLEVCRLHTGLVRRIIIASSDKAYGESALLPYVEEMPLKGQHPYEVSKSCADLIAQSYFHTYDLPLAIARCGNVFGGGDLNWSRLVPGTIRSLIRNSQPIIRSDGQYLRDYIYVKDVVQAYLILGERLEDSEVRGRAFNISNETPLSVIELVTIIQKLMDCSHLKPVIQNVAVGELHSQYLSSALARKILNWKPVYSLEAGLRETISWYRQYLTQVPQ
ncbi:MAG: NAD-dependent epimerase/dehydratase family protein [Anaerolineales bacterium]